MQWKWTSNGVTPKYTQRVHLAHTNTHVVAGTSTKHRNQMSQKLIASVYLNDHSCVSLIKLQKLKDNLKSCV